jgi:hypothetical protein|nr:MAG TPA: hypothetical protein [Bacteriophage sp.]
MYEVGKNKYLMDPSRPTRRTRNRIRRLERAIIRLEGIKYFLYPEDLANIEKRLRHCKDVINDKKLRYSDSLELRGAKKDISEIQQKIYFNKSLIRELSEKLSSLKSYLQNVVASFDVDLYTQSAVYPYSKLKIIKLREEKQRLSAALIELGKEQSDLKRNLKHTQRSLINTSSNKEKENG